MATVCANPSNMTGQMQPARTDQLARANQCLDDGGAEIAPAATNAAAATGRKPLK